MKKFLSLVLALVIVLGTFGNVALADKEDVTVYDSQDHKIQWLVDNEIVLGRKVNADGSADLDLDEHLTRSEVTKLVVYTLGLENLADALQGVMKPFPDVDIDNWANGYVSVATTQRSDIANGRRIVIGYEDGYFYPNNNVTYAELATMLVRIVKDDLTDAMERKAIWATDYMAWAEQEGILEGLTIVDSDQPVTRADAFEMIFNAMVVTGRYDKGSVKFGDKMGVVSGLRDGVLEINQEDEYKITKNTMATDGTRWTSLARNVDAIDAGSLVRFIVNEDNEVTHILELGNNKDLALRENDWFDIADYTDETTATRRASFKTTNKYTDLKIGEKEYEINKNTKFFVTDVYNNKLGPVESLEEIYDLLTLVNGKIAGNVYLGYDEVSGKDDDINVAQVIVFTEIDKYQGQEEVRRVSGWLNSAYKFKSEDTRGNEETTDVKNIPMFPSINLLEDEDVVVVRDNKKVGYRNYDDFVKISRNDNKVFRVADKGARYIALADKWDREWTFDLDRDADIFLEGQLKKGAHVQVHSTKGDRKAPKGTIDIVSIVDEEVDGELIDGIRVGEFSGYIVKANKNARLNIWELEIREDDNKYARPVRYYMTQGQAEDLQKELQKAIEDDTFKLSTIADNKDAKNVEIVFDTAPEYTNEGIRFVYAIELKATESKVVEERAQKEADGFKQSLLGVKVKYDVGINEGLVNKIENMDNANLKKLKNDLENLIEEYNELSEEGRAKSTEAKDWLNDWVDAFNKEVNVEEPIDPIK